MLAAGFQALGANVEPLPLPDVYQALQNGTVDGVEANLPLIYLQKWYEVGQVRHRQRQLLALPDGAGRQQGGLRRPQRRPADGPDRRRRQHHEASIEIFTTPGSTVAQDLVNCGVEYVTSTPAQLTALQNASASAVAELAADSQDYVTQIEAEKEALGPPAAPPPLPTDQDRGVHAASG